MSTPTQIDRPAQFLLPFAEKDYIDVRRTMGILGAEENTVYLLAEMARPGGGRMLDLIDYRYHGRKRVLYASVVRFCDDLRSKYLIADRRAPLSNPMFRYRDEDLPPFPLSDTISLGEACSVLGYQKRDAALKLSEEGHFEAYQLMQNSPWRVSRTSFASYVERTIGRMQRP